MLPYLHPITGGAGILLVLYAASLGLRMRTRPRERKVLGTRHARWAPIACGFVVAMWATGVASVIWLRPQLDLADSLHFRLGTLMALFLTGGALSARAMRSGREQWREIHPWLGAVAALLAAAHFVAGLQITP